MILKCQVERVSKLRTPAFASDPNDPNNTVHVGNVEELELSALPYEYGGGIASIKVQLNMQHAGEIGRFQPGDLVEVEIRKGGA